MTSEPKTVAPFTLSFPFANPPKVGEVVAVAPGVRWLRLPLPFKLDHVNVYLLEDNGGWAVFDSGICTGEAIEVWERVFAGPLRGVRITRVITSHHHPDHIGLAGWICERFGAPHLTSFSAYAANRMLSLDPNSTASEQSRAFYHRCGMTLELVETVADRGRSYLKWVSPLPLTFIRLLTGDTLSIGGRRYFVHNADGHAPEQVSLYCPEDGLLLVADQVIEKITPNISIWAMEPHGDPLGHYMRSLRELGSRLPEDVLVLPGHLRPFKGLQQRCAEILTHHEERCRLIFEACREPKSVDQLVPVLFRGKTSNAGELSFAFTETMAHVNHLVRRGELTREPVDDRWTFRCA